MKRIAPRSWPLPLKAAALVALVAAPALAAPYIPSTPDLGKAEGRCRADEGGPAILVEPVGMKDRAGLLKLEVYPANDADFLRDDNLLVAEGKTFRRVEVSAASTAPICIRVPGPGAYSVIPRQARIAGTVRSFSGAVQTLMEQRLEGLVQSIAQAFGASASINYRRNYPATINSAPEAAFAGDVAATLVGESHVLRAMAPSMGAEDFSFMLQAKPGAYIRIGQGGEGSCFLHNTRYDFNDDILPLGAALFSALVERSLPL